MTIKNRLDSVITSVNKKLASEEFVIPQKTPDGILVGNILIVSNGTQKDLYRHGKLLYHGIFLNKCAIKMANLLALNKSVTRIEQIYRADLRFGMALNDYAIFKDRLKRASDRNDSFKMDLYIARLCYAKDCYLHYKKHALALAA